jgi:capsule polysaccharide export protein KpsE/RkpR
MVARFDLVHYYNAKYIEDACKQLAAATAIHEDPKNGIITISITATDPVFASKIAQGYVEELDHVVTRNSTSAARRERIFLEARLKEIKQDLDDSAKALSQFSTKNKTFDLAVQGKAMVDSGTRIQDQMIIARSELAALQQTYSEDNIRVRAARARIAELQSQMGNVLGATEGDKNDVSGSSYPSIRELPALGVTYSDLARRVRVEEALWEALTRQYETARVQEEREIPTVRVLDAANVPQHKSSPIRRQIVIIGAMLSLLVACIYVLAASFWQGMDELDERKKLVTEIVSSTLNPEKWRRIFSRK